MNRGAIGKIVVYFLFAVALIWALFPLYWVFSTSVKPPSRIFTIPPTLIPDSLTFENYQRLSEVMPYLQHFLNSTIITGGALALGLIIGGVAAYGLSRYRFPGSSLILTFVVVSRMIPLVAFVIPIYFIERDWGLINQYFGVILSHLIIVLPFTIWLMKSFFDEIPKAYEEAAMVDGASRLHAMMIAMRLALPGLGTTAILAFLDSWNEFMFALTLTTTPATQTLPVAIALQLQRPYNVPWGVITAGSFLFSLPVFALGYFIQKYVARTFVLGV